MGLEDASESKLKLGDFELDSLSVDKRYGKTNSQLQMVFQNPFDTLNPSHSVCGLIGRVIKKFGVVKKQEEVDEIINKLQDTVKLPLEQICLESEYGNNLL